jgi:diguanylate cyclase (GGDEF)-like protein
MSFVVTPLISIYLPLAHIEKQVWDLPKFVVAVGMLLILLEDQIEHNKFLALHDELTGLPNRRLFQDRLSSALDRARRTNAQTALLVIDLDQFKDVNDSFGHHIGDLLLQRVAAAFSGRARRSDTVARTGGDEFSVILEEPTSRADAMRVSQPLLELLKEPLLLEDCKVQTGASIGIAIFPEDSSDAEALCIAADRRMYEDKQHLRESNEDAASDISKSLLTQESVI